MEFRLDQRTSIIAVAPMMILTDAEPRGTVSNRVLETSLWKLSAGFRPSFLADIGNWLAGSGALSFQHCAPQASNSDDLEDSEH